MVRQARGADREGGEWAGGQAVQASLQAPPGLPLFLGCSEDPALKSRLILP